MVWSRTAMNDCSASTPHQRLAGQSGVGAFTFIERFGTSFRMIVSISICSSLDAASGALLIFAMMAWTRPSMRTRCSRFSAIDQVSSSGLKSHCAVESPLTVSTR